MNKLALTTLALGISLAAPAAFAQQACPPGSWLCADITIGGGVQVAPQPQVMVNPPVYMAPPPVVVLPPRPRIYYMPPPPQRVYVQSPPVVVYQPAPMYQQPPQYYYQQQGPRYVLPPPRRGYVGLEAAVGGSYLGTPAGGSASFMGGINGGLRFRGAGHLGGELTVGVYAGQDFNGDHRTEVPFAFNGMWFFNPENRFQVYGLLGIGASWAHVDYIPSNFQSHGGLAGAEYGYIGGQAGLGGELQLSPHFSLFADVRGFVRTRIDDQRDRNAEFSHNTASGTTQTTNTSFGLVGQVGAALYF